MRTRSAAALISSCIVIAATGALLAPATSVAQDDTSGDAMKGGIRGSVVHDPAFFRESVLPLLDRNCIGCHDDGDPDNRTRHRLLPPEPGGSWSDDDVQANYESVTPLVHAPAPERSLLLLKLVPLARGGIDHDGGKADGSDFAPALIDAKGPLVQWVFGASARNAAPVAVLAPWPTTVERGTELSLDAALSFDADGDDVTIEWEIVEKPLGAEARLSQRSGAQTSITPGRTRRGRRRPSAQQRATLERRATADACAVLRSPRPQPDARGTRARRGAAVPRTRRSPARLTRSVGALVRRGGLLLPADRSLPTRQ